MGGTLGRQQGEGGEEDFRYPPATGLYFGNQFIMGGQQFPAMDPESFLFGDLQDLNFLSRLPGMPHAVPPNIKHTNTIRSLVNLHKDSLRLVQHARNEDPIDEYHVEFTFDADVPCAVTLHYFVTEVPDRNGTMRYERSAASLPSCTRYFDAALGQTFSFPVETAITGLSSIGQADLFFKEENGRFPLVICIEPELSPTANLHYEESEDDQAQARQAQTHVTIATFERSNPTGPFSIKPLIQKLNANGLSYILKEIYGIERKTEEEEEEEDEDDDSTECVVCMSEARDTMVLPCRHLCLCNPCAEVLRYQANKCPICRSAFHSLLQIRVARPLDGTEDPDEEADDNAPMGHKTISVVAALRAEPATTSSSSQRNTTSGEPAAAAAAAAAAAPASGASSNSSTMRPPPAVGASGRASARGSDTYIEVLGRESVASVASSQDDEDESNPVLRASSVPADASENEQDPLVRRASLAAGDRSRPSGDDLLHDLPSNERLNEGDEVIDLPGTPTPVRSTDRPTTAGSTSSALDSSVHISMPEDQDS